MVIETIKEFFDDISSFKDLDIVSDGICKRNNKKYIDFDDFIKKLYSSEVLKGDTLSSCDTVLLNKQKQHIIFVEFKNMDSINDENELSNFWTDKNKSLFLKITDSILALSYILALKYNISYDNFMNLSKSFIYVYKSDNYKKKIKKHLKNKFSRYNFLLKNISIIESKNFEEFLTCHNL